MLKVCVLGASEDDDCDGLVNEETCEGEDEGKSLLDTQNVDTLLPYSQTNRTLIIVQFPTGISM